MRRRGDKNPSHPPMGETPPHGQRAQLTGADGEKWPVRISERDGDVLMLVVLSQPDGHQQAPGEPVTLETTSDHGVLRFAGEAVLEDHDLVRFRVHDAMPEVEQRREFVRVRAPRQVVLAVSGTDTIGSTYSLDLSGGGMLLSGPETLRLDDHIRFRLHLDSSSPAIKGRGRVVRKVDDRQRAIVFEDISRKDRERLIHFIFERQREARARDRGLT